MSARPARQLGHDLLQSTGQLFRTITWQRADRQNLHLRHPHNSLPMATAVSAMRFEKPHSLSYHDRTRTSLPSMTFVWSMWNTEEWLSWLKSEETFGWSVTARMPLSSCSAARRIAVLISSLVVSRLERNLKSTTETLGTGTRIAVPSRRPLSSG